MTEQHIDSGRLAAVESNDTVELRHVLADETTFTNGTGRVRVDGDMTIVFELDPAEARALGRKLIAMAD